MCIGLLSFFLVCKTAERSAIPHPYTHNIYGVLSLSLSHTVKEKTGDEGVSMCSLECHPRRRKIKAQRARPLFVFFIFVIVAGARVEKHKSWMRSRPSVRYHCVCECALHTTGILFRAALLNKYALALAAAAHLEINKAAHHPLCLHVQKRGVSSKQLQSYNFAERSISFGRSE